MENQRNILNPWHDIPPPDTLILRQALEDAFYKYRRNAEHRSLPQILSRMGKKIFYDIIAKPETKAPYIPLSYVPDDWFSQRLRTHLLESTAEAPNDIKFQVDNSNQYLQYLCHTREQRIICIARVVHYVRKSSKEEVDVMMVMSWEKHNWFVTGYLKATPSFKHAVRREWARTPARAYLAYLEQHPNEMHEVYDGLQYDGEYSDGDAQSLDSESYAESYDSETETVDGHHDNPVTEYLTGRLPAEVRRPPAEGRNLPPALMPLDDFEPVGYARMPARDGELPMIQRSYHEIVTLGKQLYGLSELQVRRMLYKPCIRPTPGI